MRFSSLLTALLVTTLGAAPALAQKSTLPVPRPKPNFNTTSRLAAPAARQSGYAAAFAALDAGRYDEAFNYARRGGDPILNMVLRGYEMERPGNDYSFDDLASFISDHPDWPTVKGIRMIAEQKIPSGATYEQVVNWFNANAPLTSVGFYRYMDALDALGYTQNIAAYVRGRWTDADMDTDEMTAFYARFGRFLRPQDHKARLDRLLWANQVTAARAVYPYVNQGQRAVAEARLAIANQLSTANQLYGQVPSSLRSDPGLLYERLRAYRKSDRDDAANEILLEAPDNLGNAGKWWDERNIMIRRAIEKHDFKLAYRLAANPGDLDGFDQVQANFLAGWLALRFVKRPDLARQHFEELLAGAGTPISKARGYYWLGRTFEAQNQKHEAEQAYESAAALNTTFYGQLATTRLYAQPVIHATPEPTIPSTVRGPFFRRDIVRAIERLDQIGQTDRAARFFKAATEGADQRFEFCLLMELAYQLQRPDWAIKAGKAAAQKNMLMRAGAFPVLSMNIPTPPEVAFTHAIIRQESLFNATAGSGAGARGLMQLMPRTAQEVARKMGVAYSDQRLTDPNYNVMLGTNFMQRQIDNFDGSYVLSLAGYNAGPARVRQWIQMFGDPRTGAVDPIDWIELIPIYETRNYVERIIENLQFYRARLAGGQAPLMIVQDLRR